MSGASQTMTRAGMHAALGLALALAAVVFGACADASLDGDDGAGGDAPATDDGKADSWGAAAKKTLVLRGTVITMDEARGSRQVLSGGAVVVKGGKITAILEAGAALPTGSDVIVLPSRTGASDWVIAPGLINAHNHLAYNTAQLYRDLPLYQNTYQWRDERYYDTHIQLPKRLFSSCSADVDELGVAPDGADRRVPIAGLMGRYAEVKELAGGTTATQGSYFGTSVPRGYGNHLVRNLDWTSFGARRVSQASLGILVRSFDPRSVIARFEDGSIDAWLVHLLEGTDQESEDEFECLRAMGLVRRGVAIIHGIALTRPQLAEMAEAGVALIASPLDNLLYYGRTADLKSAWQLGVNVSIGTDWSPAGSKNLLAELKVVDLLNKQVWGSTFTSRDLVQMVTSNPADAIGWGGKAGRLRVGLFADIMVVRKRGSGTYRSIIEATEADVRLVLVGGEPLYGDVDAMKQLKPGDYEVVSSSCGFHKAVDITTTSTTVEHGAIAFADVRAMLETALRFDPEWLYTHSDDARQKGWTRTQFKAELAKQFPYALEPRALNPLFTCEDTAFLDEVRTDPNIRTAYGGVCLDLRPAYGKASAMDCGAMPAHPAVLTAAMHDGTVPERPAAWCAQQSWSGSGALPQP